MADRLPAILCLTDGALHLARRIAEAVGGEVHARTNPPDVLFSDTGSHIADLFLARTPIIGICAAGILIRTLAPHLTNKREESPVLAVSHDGASVVPLLGGHRGANRLATRIAEALDTRPSLTTGGETELGVALDDPPPGWRLANPDAAKPVMARLLSGAGAQLTGEAASEAGWLRGLPAGDEISIAVTVKPDSQADLVVHPIQAMIGVGSARHCPADELANLVRAALASADIAPGAIAAINTIDLKADEAAILQLSQDLDLPLRLFSPTELEAETPRLANPSDVVFSEVGCHGVAEGAALAAAGPDAALIVEKQKSANATVAIARTPELITTLRGRKRGRVSLIGIGPGRADWRTPEATRLIAAADELVGYGFYIDLLGPLAAKKHRRNFALGEEADRCRYALERAGEGLDVALICSGDAGIYAMGALVYELLDTGDLSDAARRVEVMTTPGVSAMQAAAARIGAPLGHDFCAISLSDLLTPRGDILKRLAAAAEGDFVIAFYNPVSKRRRDLFQRALETLGEHRPPDTPVVLARSLGRPDETLTVHALADVTVDQVDMMTTVVVGSSQSRTVSLAGHTHMYTPRGYANKTDPDTNGSTQ